MKSSPSFKIALVLILIAGLTNLILGIYHLTTREGWRSGITELLTTALLLITFYLLLKAHKS